MESSSSASSTLTNGNENEVVFFPDWQFTDSDSMFLLHVLCSQASFIDLSDSRSFVDVIYKLEPILRRFLRREYNSKQICMRLATFKSDKMSFDTFLLTPGVAYDRHTNTVSVDAVYWTFFPFGEDASQAKLRTKGMPEYDQLCILLDVYGMKHVDLEWVLVQLDE